MTGKRFGSAALFLLFLLVGCAGVQQKPIEASAPVQKEPAEEIKIKEFSISPGDELKIYVLQHDELTRQMKIPPDGIIFYPIVGEIDTKGKTLRVLRDAIYEGLSQHREQALLPGDEIQITVFRNEEYNRKFIIPSDGVIFFPNVGTINIEGSTPTAVGKVITDGLQKYVVNPQVVVDIVKLNNPSRIADPQVGIDIIAIGGQKVYVLGEVNKPGIFLADGSTNVVEAVSAAGGPTLDGKIENVLLIRPTDGGKPDLRVIDMKSILTGGAGDNMILARGDIVFVPRTFISNVDRFFEHLSKIVSPLFTIEKGYWIGQNIELGPKRSRAAIATE